MPLSLPVAELTHRVEAQGQLAALSTVSTIREMHEELERLYRAQLAGMEAKVRLERLRYTGDNDV